MNLITLFLTCADKAEADKITAKLLDNKLAACVRQTSVSSAFIWQGRQEQADEIQLIIESTNDKFDKIEAMVKQLHSYETPALIAYSVARASAGVEAWVKESTE